MTKKVKLLDREVREQYYKIVTGVSTVISLILIFVEIPDDWKIKTGIIFSFVMVTIYFCIWRYANNLTNIKLNIDGSDVQIKVGDIFKQDELKVIPFNEYFDTKVDNVIIGEKSLNGQYINKYHPDPKQLDTFISEDKSIKDDIISTHVKRNGKTIKYKLGSSVLINDYVLTAFTKFDEKNKAFLSIYDYLNFLVYFWDEINRIYAQKSVSVPIFGSGITRFRGGFEDIDDNELLNIMIWTFKISKIKFKYPAKLSIIIHEKKIDQINIFKLKEFEK